MNVSMLTGQYRLFGDHNKCIHRGLKYKTKKGNNKNKNPHKEVNTDTVSILEC